MDPPRANPNQTLGVRKRLPRVPAPQVPRQAPGAAQAPQAERQHQNSQCGVCVRSNGASQKAPRSRGGLFIQTYKNAAAPRRCSKGNTLERFLIGRFIHSSGPMERCAECQRISSQTFLSSECSPLETPATAVRHFKERELARRSDLLLAENAEWVARNHDKLVRLSAPTGADVRRQDADQC